MRPAAAFARVASDSATFYRYRAGRPTGANPSLPPPTSVAGGEVALMIRRRLLLLLINEAVRIVEDGCVADPGDLEVISILGLGFPRERGGLLFYAQEIGLSALLTFRLCDARLTGSNTGAASAVITNESPDTSRTR